VIACLQKGVDAEVLGYNKSRALLMRMRQREGYSEPYFFLYDNLLLRRDNLKTLALLLGDEKLAWEVERYSHGKDLWREYKNVKRGNPVPDRMAACLPGGVVCRMNTALARPDDPLARHRKAPASAEEDVQVVGEKTWAERDKELRKNAVVLE